MARLCGVNGSGWAPTRTAHRLIGAFGGVPDFSALFFTVNNSKFLIGDFINAVIAFLILAAIIYYFVVLPVQKLVDRFQPAVPPAPTRECPFCLSKIPVKATRCAFCTSDVTDKVDAAIQEMTHPRT